MPGAKSEKDLIPPGMEGLLFKERSWVGLGRRRRARPTAKGQCSNDTCKIFRFLHPLFIDISCNLSLLFINKSELF